MSTRPSLTCQWHCAVRIRLARGMGLSTDCLRDEIGRPTPHQRRDETPATGTCDLKVGGRSLISWDRYSDSSAVLACFWVPSHHHPRHQSWEGTGTAPAPVPVIKSEVVANSKKGGPTSFVEGGVGPVPPKQGHLSRATYHVGEELHRCPCRSHGVQRCKVIWLPP